MESDRQLQEDTFNQELLKLHQRCRQKNKKRTEWNIDNERSKSNSLVTI